MAFPSAVIVPAERPSWVIDSSIYRRDTPFHSCSIQSFDWFSVVEPLETRRTPEPGSPAPSGANVVWASNYIACPRVVGPHEGIRIAIAPESPRA
jgi:hypothetical protein